MACCSTRRCTHYATCVRRPCEIILRSSGSDKTISFPFPIHAISQQSSEPDSRDFHWYLVRPIRVSWIPSCQSLRVVPRLRSQAWQSACLESNFRNFFAVVLMARLCVPTSIENLFQAHNRTITNLSRTSKTHSPRRSDLPSSNVAYAKSLKKSRQTSSQTFVVFIY